MSNAGPPIIDITDLERTDALIAIDDACRDWGFFQIVGHGIGEHLIVALRRQMREFFAQSLAAKHENLRTADNPWGFYDRELTKHTPDWKQIYDYGPPDGGMLRPQWPAALPEFQPVIRAFYDACDALALRLLGALSINLGMPATFLDALFRPAHTSFLRLNYYPRCRRLHGASLGVNSHTDSGALTLLLQDEQPGLEVLHGNGWHLVEPRQRRPRRQHRRHCPGLVERRLSCGTASRISQCRRASASVCRSSSIHRTTAPTRRCRRWSMACIPRVIARSTGVSFALAAPPATMRIRVSTRRSVITALS